ncbi:MAG: cellulase family glycosylhydrolase [Chloroflexi bacterium]|nr:cellulase family glycosylhydrolase [Chloroflexota bacterium]
MRCNRILIAAAAAALIIVLPVPATASAMLFGVETNGELINSDRTRADQASALTKIDKLGAGAVRVNIGWNDVATDACRTQSLAALRNPNNSCYNWSVVDGLSEQAAERKLRVIASVSRAPRWLHGSSDPYYLGRSGRQWRHTLVHFEAFMQAIALRYKPGNGHGEIRWWTIWNEPNSKTFWKPMDTASLRRAAPKRYAQMYGRALVAIKKSQARATVALGPTGPKSTIKPLTYVSQVQRALPAFLPGRTLAAKRRQIGAWAHNPYAGPFNSPRRGIFKQRGAVGMGNLKDLTRQLDRAAITRGVKIWATEFGWQTNPPDEYLGIRASLQARYMGEAFDLLRSNSRVRVAIWYGLTDPTDLDDWQSGVYYASGRPKRSLIMWRRPISVPIGATRRGRTVRVWSRSNVRPSSTRIVYSTNGRTWRTLPRTRRIAGGGRVAYPRLTRSTWFATTDSSGVRGPSRKVLVR